MLTPLPIDPDVTHFIAKAQDGSPMTFSPALAAACDPEADQGTRNHARNVLVKMARLAWRRALQLEAIARLKCGRCSLVLMGTTERTSGLCTSCVREIAEVRIAVRTEALAALVGSAGAR